MRPSSPILAFGLLVLSFGSSPSVASSDEVPVFAVRYAPDGVSFSGRVDSEETGQLLAEAVRAVRPDLPIRNEGLTVDSDIALPPLADLKSLLAELGISTHDGGFALWDDAILIRGLTDSRLTFAALKIRLDPMLEGRALINRICIVSTDDLPDISVKLASGEETGPLLDFDLHPSAPDAFEPPGIVLAKLYSTLALMSDPSPFTESAGTDNSPGGNPGVVRATPIEESFSPGTAEADASEPTGESPNPLVLKLRAVPAGPVTTYVELEPIRFGRNSFLLQANQKAIVDGVVKQLREPPLSEKRILLKPLMKKGGADAFTSYLADRRGAEVESLLVDSGIARGRISIRPTDSDSTVDEGEVRIVVAIPPPPPKPEPEPESENIEAEPIVPPGSAGDNAAPPANSAKPGKSAPLASDSTEAN